MVALGFAVLVALNMIVQTVNLAYLKCFWSYFYNEWQEFNTRVKPNYGVALQRPKYIAQIQSTNRKYMPSVNKDEVAGKNQPEDVQWLSLLSSSELDFLTYLKKLVIQRAKVVGHEGLADKFDLKLLRVVGFVLMESLKERLEGSSVLSGLETSSLLNACRSIDLNHKDNFNPIIIEELNTSVIANSRKRKESGR